MENTTDTLRLRASLSELLLQGARGIDRALSPVHSVFFAIASFIVGAMVIVVVWDIVYRLLLSGSVPGVIEIEEFAMVTLTYVLLAGLQSQKGHIRIPIFVEKVPRVGRMAIETFIWIGCLVFFVISAWRSFVAAQQQEGLVSPEFGIPIAVFMSFAGVGFCLLVAVLFADTLRSAGQMLKEGSGTYLIAAIVVAGLLFVIPALIPTGKFGGLGAGAAGVALLMGLMFLGMPIGFAMALSGFIGIWVIKDFDVGLNIVGLTSYTSLTNSMLIVVPFFVLMGELALHSGISKDLFNTAYKWFGKKPGGLAISTVAGCACFAAVCGESMATALTMGAVALPEMKKKKYDMGLACGSLAAGGTLGILIPPSVGFIIYAILTEESVGRLFLAGMVPGIMLTAFYMLAIYLVVKRNPQMGPPGEATNWGEKLGSLKGVLGMLFLIGLIMGGILTGVFTPVEGGAAGAFGAFLLGLAKRCMDRGNLKEALTSTVLMIGRLFPILIGVGIFGYFLATTRLPELTATAVKAAGLSPYLVLLSVIVIYLILGSLMNVIPMVMLTLPAIFPTILAMGFDPVWFGVLMVVLMEMGQITPPIGINVFAITAAARDVPMTKVFKGIIPFFICQLVMLVILAVFPAIATFLPDLLMK